MYNRDRKMSDYELDASDALEDMEGRHVIELKEYQKNLIGKQMKPKWSKDLLNLRRIQETIAKQKK